MSGPSRRLEIVAEAVVVAGSFFAAALLRFGDEALGYRGIFGKGALCTAVVIAVLYYAELYERRARRRAELFLRLGQCMVAASVTLAVVFFLVPSLTPTRTASSASTTGTRGSARARRRSTSSARSAATSR